MPVPPKRDDQRRRTNTPKAQKASQFLDEPLGPDVPEGTSLLPDTMGYRWYQSLRTSGQAVFYTDSDWMTALFLAESINMYMATGNGQILTAVLRGMGDLMVTEGSRRSARLELERELEIDQAELAAVRDLEEMRQKFGG